MAQNLERSEKSERKTSQETMPMKLPICSAPFNILLSLDGHQNKILKDQTKLTQHILEGFISFLDEFYLIIRFRFRVFCPSHVQRCKPTKMEEG